MILPIATFDQEGSYELSHSDLVRCDGETQYALLELPETSAIEVESWWFCAVENRCFPKLTGLSCAVVILSDVYRHKACGPVTVIRERPG